MQGTQAQLRRLRDDSLRYAQRDTEALARTRTQFRAHYLGAQRCEWDAAFWAKENPERSKGIGANVPRLQKYMASDAATIARLEASAAEYLATARKAQYALHLQGPLSLVLPEPGWWTLVRMCWQGWRSGRVARCGNSML